MLNGEIYTDPMSSWYVESIRAISLGLDWLDFDLRISKVLNADQDHTKSFISEINVTCHFCHFWHNRTPLSLKSHESAHYIALLTTRTSSIPAATQSGKCIFSSLLNLSLRRARNLLPNVGRLYRYRSRN